MGASLFQGRACQIEFLAIARVKTNDVFRSVELLNYKEAALLLYKMCTSIVTEASDMALQSPLSYLFRLSDKRLPLRYARDKHWYSFLIFDIFLTKFFYYR